MRFFAGILVAVMFAGAMLLFSGYSIEFTWDDGPGIRLVKG